MVKRIRYLFLAAVVVMLVILPACSAAATPAIPTIDPNMIYTQAVLTVQAGLAQTEAAKPSATNTLAPTATLEPTATLPPPPTPTLIAQTLPAPGAATVAPAAPTVAGQRPVATTAVMGQTGDHASFGSQSPADNSKFPGLSNQQIFWSLVNTGTTTWTTGYKLVWIGGRQLSGEVSIPVTKEIKPGQKFDFYTRMITPENKGTYTSFWAITNPSGFRFYEVYLKFIVE